MLNSKIGYSYNDVTVVPSIISDVSSRSECNPFIKDNFLPIFASPMASVIDENNLETFLSNGIIPILPRNININIRKIYMDEYHWVALSLKEFEDLFIDNYLERITKFGAHYFICVDIANGHMKSLYDKCIIAKKNAMAGKYKLTIMTGNIANPETYKWICTNARYFNYNTHEYELVIDYLRCGIGGGSGCITTSNVSAHYPQASLIDECYKVKQELIRTKSKNYELPKIVADGGIRNYDHVIKALALGADYVMIGSLFAQCIESAGEKTTKSLSTKLPLRFPIERYKDFSVDSKGNWFAYYTDEFIEENSKTWKNKVDEWKKLVEEGLSKDNADYKLAILQYQDKIKELKEKRILGSIDVKFFGMASADGQKSISGKKTKTAEGITKWLPVKYTLSGWTENMISYLRSIMSYCNCKDIKEFIGKPELIVNSISEIQAVNK